MEVILQTDPSKVKKYDKMMETFKKFIAEARTPRSGTSRTSKASKETKEKKEKNSDPVRLDTLGMNSPTALSMSDRGYLLAAYSCGSIW